MTQPNNDIIKNYLKIAYENSIKIGGNMDDKLFGKIHTDKFIEFINKKNFSDKKILEIGCGSCYLLHRLKELGAKVIGIDLSEESQRCSKKLQIEVIKDSFPSDLIKDKFDIIILSSVIEHFFDPISILKDIKKYLKNDGQLIIGVVDSEPYFDIGDISIFFHEHISYYTKDSLKQSLNISGYKDIKVENSTFNKLIYCSATPGNSFNLEDDCYEKSLIQVRNFYKKHISCKEKLFHFIESCFLSGTTLGFYIPGRVINLLTLISCNYFGFLRFFTDDKENKNKYFPGFSIPIELRSNLLFKPTDYVLIMSLSFGERIKNQLLESLPKTTKIYTMEEFFNSEMENIL